MSRTIILDTETTGLTEEAEIIQLSFIELDGEDIISHYDQIFMSTSELDPEVITLTGITTQKQKFLSKGLTFSDVIRENPTLLEDTTILAYNLPFDSKMLASNYNRAGVDFNLSSSSYCLMKWYQDYKGLARFPKLTNVFPEVCRELGVSVSEVKANFQRTFNLPPTAHSALFDVYMTYMIYLLKLRKE